MTVPARNVDLSSAGRGRAPAPWAWPCSGAAIAPGLLSWGDTGVMCQPVIWADTNAGSHD